MDFATLKHLIEAGLKGSQYVLDTAVLGSPAISAMAADYLPAATLTLVPDATTPFVLPPGATSIIVKGSGFDAPFKGLALDVTFTLDHAGAVSFALRAVGDQDWTLDKSFAVFAGNIGAALRFKGAPAAPALTLLSDAQGACPAGLAFDGTIDFSVMSVGIASLLGIASQAVRGPVILLQGGSQFVSLLLRGPDLANVDLWLANVAVQFWIGNDTIGSPGAATATPIPYIALGASIPFGTSQAGAARHIGIAVHATNFDAAIRFEADIADLLDASLDELGTLIGGAALSSTLPPRSSFPIESVLKVSDLYMDVEPTGKSVACVGVQVVSTSDWHILHLASTGRDIVARDVKLDFTVLTPFSQPAPYLNLGGVFPLTDTADLYLSASFPDFEVMGYLTEGSALAIADFIALFVGPCQGIPDLSITTLYFDLVADDYTVDIEITGFWPINSSQSLALIVEELGFSVTWNAGILSASFSGTMRVAGVDVSILAAYGTGAGWQFSGQTGAGEQIHIGDVVAYLARTFGLGAPPAWLQKISLQDLKVDFNTQTRDFDFAVTGTIPLAGGKLVIKTVFAMAAVADGYTRTLSGTLTVGAAIFLLQFSSSPSDTVFTASWHAADATGYLQFEDIARAFGLPDMQVPPELQLSLESVTLEYDFGNARLLLSAASATYGKAVLVALENPATTKWQYFFGLNIDKPIPISNLPLIGKLIPADDTVEIADIQVVIASDVIDDALALLINPLILLLGPGYPAIPDTDRQGMQAGLGFAMQVAVGAYRIPIMFDTGTAPSAPSRAMLCGPRAATAPGTAPVSAAGGSDGVLWFNLQKTFGPVSIEKIGVQYKDKAIYILVNMHMSGAGLTLGLIGFGIGSSITTFDPRFEIQGIDVSYSGGGVEISGGMRGSLNPVNFVGELMVNVESFGIAALAGYTTIEGSPSMFLYAVVNGQLGGPACFFVTGLAGGFGYNRDLQVPDVSGVAAFPLVQWANAEHNPPGMDMGGDIATQVNGVLQRLSDSGIVAPRAGQYWLAAGVTFTSFELANSFALAVVKFGAAFEIDLLGTTTIAIPPGEPVIYADMQLLASFRPAEGFIGISGQLTSRSYVLSPDCHLSGGFAYYFWFSGEHEGNFVITMGGYNPNFEAPGFYPAVPRLGINWNVSDNLAVTGDEYFAVTSVAVMAGGALSATWNSGGIKAWFNLQADFLMVYQPFHYYLSASVDIGASFRISLIFTHITISIHVGASVEIWGPEFTGRATIDLDIISFTISFNSAAQASATTISWHDFATKMLPGKKALSSAVAAPGADGVYINVPSGIVKTLSTAPDQLNFVVNPETFALAITTTIPIKESLATFTGLVGLAPDADQPHDAAGNLMTPNEAFGVGPAGVDSASFLPALAVTITLTNAPAGQGKEITLQCVRLLSNVPNALWQTTAFDSKGNPLLDNPLQNTTSANVVTGYRVVPVQLVPDHTLPIDSAYLQYTIDPHIGQFAWSAASSPATGPLAGSTVEDSIMLAASVANRAALLPALRAVLTALASTVNVDAMSDSTHAALLSQPVMHLLGQQSGPESQSRDMYEQ